MKKLLISALALFVVGSAVAQEGLGETFNKAVAAYNSKDYASAASAFEALIDQGIDSDDVDVQGWVATAKKSIPVCYYMLGGMAAQRGDFNTAIENFTKSADKAALYGDLQQERKSNMWVATIYKKWGETPFNEKNYAEAAEIFAKGYAADPNNMEMANFLGICYCELCDFQKGLVIFNEIASQDNPKYAEDVVKAKENIKLYTNNRIAKLQGENDFDGIIAVADEMLAVNPQDALAQKIRLQALFDKKDYAGVIASAEEAAAGQTDEEERSDVYFILGAAYNARTMPQQAIDALSKVTAGANVAAAQKTVAQLKENAAKANS
ncbi:tetratricopeptide repeat protein [Alistipes putredinis]|uniref:tetratricopeptide repeat protein n=1 Tax=Alistipes putredinis TaxID=28117 RepID=UPI003991C21F